MSPGRRILVAVACVTAAGMLTACDADTVGAAAVVGEEPISIRELQDQVRDVTVSSPEGGEPTGDQAEVQQTLLERMIQHELLAAVGRDEGIEVTEAEIDTFIDEQVLAQAPDDDIVRDQLVAQALIDRFGGQQQLIEALTGKADEIGVEVNPRYGTWSEIFLEPSSGSISEPAGGGPTAAEPAPTPAG